MDITILYTKNLTGQTSLNDVVCTPTVVSCEISASFNAYASVVSHFSSVSSDRGAFIEQRPSDYEREFSKATEAYRRLRHENLRGNYRDRCLKMYMISIYGFGLQLNLKVDASKLTITHERPGRYFLSCANRSKSGPAFPKYARSICLAIARLEKNI